MSLFRTIHAEFYKFRKSMVWTVLFISPILSGLIAYSGYEYGSTKHEWLWIYTLMVSIHGMLLLPLLTGAIVAFICRYEHLHGGWKQYLSHPVQRWQVYIVKFGLAATVIAVIQFLMFFALIGVGMLNGIDQPFPTGIIVKSLFGGWIATFPLIALQLWVSTAWSSFAAPMAINVVCTLPAILISQSADYGPFYPWSQPFLAMLQWQKDDFLFVSVETLMFVIVGSFVVFIVGGLTFFNRRAY